jgi:hypothetical protein
MHLNVIKERERMYVQLHSSLTSALDWDKYSTLAPPPRFTRRERASLCKWICVPTAGLDVFETTRIPYSKQESNQDSLDVQPAT